MPLDLYYTYGSSPCFAVILTAKALGIELNMKYINYPKKEHITPEFLKMNPEHSIPTLDDNGFILWESRAIMMYLVNRYSKNNSLYPDDPKKRASIDQKLYYDMTLYKKLCEYYYPKVFFNGTADPEKLLKLKDCLKFFEVSLSTTKFATGDKMTLADIALAATFFMFEFVGFNLNDYPKVARWFQDIKKLLVGYEDFNSESVVKLKEFIEYIAIHKLTEEEYSMY